MTRLTKLRAIRNAKGSSRRSVHCFIQADSCNITMVATAAKLSWKLGPAIASGQNSRTTNAPNATRRSVSASRPIANAVSTSKAAIHDLTVGTSAPASSVYPTAPNAANAAEINGTGKRSASGGINASVRLHKKNRKPTTAVTCSPLIDSRWAMPLSRIACASCSSILP